ncbi:MAG: ABC transporter ATP-binding protein [Gemmatimonadota bacterium]|nr:ABC transporter ATP-binding protein [Gemmatimonadota bacterium]
MTIGPAGRPLLAGEGLVREAGRRRILDVERVEAREGEILALLGPNGAGKTTLLHALSLLRPADSGVVSFAGFAGRDAARALRRRSAFVFQRPHMWDGPVRWNLELGLAAQGRPRHGVEEMARALGLERLLGAPARTLSAGEAQRVALGRALLLDPDVLFMDEPTANLDAAARTALREDLDRLGRSRARSLVLATHDRSEAFYLADRVVVLREGRVVQAGTPAELFENPADPFIASVTGAELALRGVVEEGEDGLLRVATDGGGPLLVAVGRAAAGRNVRISYRPEDLLLSRDAPAGSARNRFRGRIAEVRSLGALVRVRLDAPLEAVAVVTRAAADELRLTAGEEVWIQVKATALHAFEI